MFVPILDGMVVKKNRWLWLMKKYFKHAILGCSKVIKFLIIAKLVFLSFM